MKTYGLRDWADYAAPFSDGSLDVYLYDIGQVPPLGPEEESSCIEHVRADGFSAEPYVKRLVEAHLGLVVSMAKRYQNEHININIIDLIQRGNVGLFRAVETLRSFRNDRFSDHARHTSNAHSPKPFVTRNRAAFSPGRDVSQPDSDQSIDVAIHYRNLW